MGFRCVLKNLLHSDIAVVIPKRVITSSHFLLGATAKAAFPAFHLNSWYSILWVKIPNQSNKKTQTNQPTTNQTTTNPNPYVEKANIISKSMKQLLRKCMKGDTLLVLDLSSAWVTVQNITFKDLLLNKDCSAHHLYRNNNKKSTVAFSCRKGNYTNKEA